jgi:hypothetical protein
MFEASFMAAFGAGTVLRMESGEVGKFLLYFKKTPIHHKVYRCGENGRKELKLTTRVGFEPTNPRIGGWRLFYLFSQSRVQYNPFSRITIFSISSKESCSLSSSS